MPNLKLLNEKVNISENNLRDKMPSVFNILLIDRTKTTKRCVYATEICSKESPKLEKVGEAHFFACHRAKELGFVDEK